MPEVDEEASSADMAAWLGKFGTHARVEQRARAERLASMRPDDKRRHRPVTKVAQLNVCVPPRTKALAHELSKTLKKSIPALLEELLEAAAKKHGIKLEEGSQ